MTFGSRLLLDVINGKVQTSPSQIWLRYFQNEDALRSGNILDITFQDLHRAVDRLAWHLSQILQHAQHDTSSEKKVVCYIGPSDARYFIFALAAAKAGWQALFSSPKNNASAHLSLMRATACHHLALPIEGFRHGIADSDLSQEKLHISEIPSLEDLLDTTAVEAFPEARRQDYSDSAYEPFMHLHTSGSTGEPKPVAITNGLLAAVDAQQTLAPIDGVRVSAFAWKDKPVYVAMPPFHSAGINQLAYSIFQNTQIILGPRDMTPSTTVLRRMLELDIARAGVMAPSILVDATAEEDLLQLLEKWDNVGFGGAPLPQNVGDKLWQHIRIVQMLGSTETFNLPELPPQAIDEWPYHRFHPGLGIQWRPQADNMHELVLVRDQSVAQHQGAFFTFPNLGEYPMKDLYSSHPTKEGLWLYQGRVDDTIVLENGEKFNPKSAELFISGFPGISSALIVGSSRMQAALLVEPKSDGSPPATDRMWEIVQQANQRLPRHAQISREYIRFVPNGAFLKSAKGEIRRAMTEKSLANDIEDVYRSAAESHGGSAEIRLDFSGQGELTDSLTKLIQEEFVSGEKVSRSASLMDLGLDSLQVSQLAKKIRTDIKSHDAEAAEQVSTRMLYDSANVVQLAKNSMALLAESSDSESSLKAGSGVEENCVQTTLEHFLNKIDALRADPRTFGKKSSPATILITGSTGSLGSHVVATLGEKQGIAKIICLNRRSRRKRTPPLKAGSIPIETIEADLSQQSFDLSAKDYDRLHASVTHVIHIAWPVNFEFPLSYFSSQLEACHNLISFASSSPHSPSTTFISSVGAANRWSQKYAGPVPEKILRDLDVSERMGYAQSKQIAELMFDRAAKNLSLDVTVCRVGQIAGPVKSGNEGVWNSTEWFPRLLRTSTQIGKLPRSLGAMDRIDWIPVDLLAGVLADTVIQPQQRQGPWSWLPSCFRQRKDPQSPARVLHFVNPHGTAWSDISTEVSKTWATTKLVSYPEWLQTVEETADTPASALQDFFRDIGDDGRKKPVFSTKATEKRCPGLGRLRPVGAEWVGMWIRQLEGKGEM